MWPALHFCTSCVWYGDVGWVHPLSAIGDLWQPCIVGYNFVTIERVKSWELIISCFDISRNILQWKEGGGRTSVSVMGGGQMDGLQGMISPSIQYPAILASMKPLALNCLINELKCFITF